MAIKDLLAVVDTGEQDDRFVRDALNFAECHGARLTFLILSAFPSTDYIVALGPPYVLRHEFTSAVDDKEKRILETARPSNVEVRTISDRPEIIFAKAAVQARYVDLVLVGPAEAYDYSPIRRYTLETVLLASGRPGLVLPSGHGARPLDHIAIGWNATREATHALRDALGFALPGARIDVLVVGGKPTVEGHGSEPGADIAHYLARHGFVATVYPLEAGDRSEAEALVDAARQQGAAILALGAYGHSRLRELFLGGVTRDLIDGAPLPLMFSH